MSSVNGGKIVKTESPAPAGVAGFATELIGISGIIKHRNGCH
jgi:hypothetical protein